MIDGESAVGRPWETRDGQGTVAKQQGSQEAKERQGEVGCGRRLRSWRFRQARTAGGLPGLEEVSRARRSPARFATQALKPLTALAARRLLASLECGCKAEKSSIRFVPGRSMQFLGAFCALPTLPASLACSIRRPTNRRTFRGAALAGNASRPSACRSGRCNPSPSVRGRSAPRGREGSASGPTRLVSQLELTASLSRTVGRRAGKIGDSP